MISLRILFGTVAAASFMVGILFAMFAIPSDDRPPLLSSDISYRVVASQICDLYDGRPYSELFGLGAQGFTDFSNANYSVLAGFYNELSCVDESGFSIRVFPLPHGRE